MSPKDLQIQHFRTIEHGELNGLVSELVEILHVCEREITQALRTLAQLKQPDTQSPAARRPFERAVCGSR